VRVLAPGISCIPSGQIVCAGDACHTAGACSPATGICSDPALAEGASCSDGIDCTGPDTCKSLPAVQNFDTVPVFTLPGGWTTFSSVGTPYSTTTTAPQVGSPNAVATDSPTTTSDKWLQSPPYHIAPGATAVLEFDNWYNLERLTNPDAPVDGAVLEIKIGNAPNFTNIVMAGGSFVTGGYNATIAGAHALNGQQGWSGTSAGFAHTKVNLPAAAAGQTVVLRWRQATDFSDAPPAPNGQRIDNVRVSNDLSACSGATLAPPAEVTTDKFLANKTTYTWNAVPTASTYDIVRGSVNALPVGPGGGEETHVCGTASLGITSTVVPSAGLGYFYVVRAKNQTCPGTYGAQTGGTPRTTTTCP